MLGSFRKRVDFDVDEFNIDSRVERMELRNDLNQKYLNDSVDWSNQAQLKLDALRYTSATLQDKFYSLNNSEEDFEIHAEVAMEAYGSALEQDDYSKISQFLGSDRGSYGGYHIGIKNLAKHLVAS